MYIIESVYLLVAAYRYVDTRPVISTNLST